MQLTSEKELRRFLESKGFTFKKGLGQNFLIDDTVCPRMAEAACSEGGGVLEIGPGAGVLTTELAKRAKRVVAIEIDERLKSILAETLKDYDNAEVIFGDCMKLDLLSLINNKFADCDRVTVCANLPYYITSPVVMMLLEAKLPIESVTVMVQKEAAERLSAEVGTREAGAVSVAVQYYAEPELLFYVDRDCFLPAPKVDSAVIKLNIREGAPIEIGDEKFFFSLVRAGFNQRRKTVVNSVSSGLGIEKAKVFEALGAAGLSDTARIENLTMQELAVLSKELKNRL